MVRRGIVQALWTAASNSYAVGFIQGRIYQGPLKRACLPGLNCYSCPGAVGSCPIGALQSVISGREYQASLYVMGFLVMIGAFMGRMVCGWLCPFGWAQDLLYRLNGSVMRRMPRLRAFIAARPQGADSPSRYVKFGVLAVFVILLPMLAVDEFQFGKPWFCAYICPAGTLMAGTPLAIGNAAIRSALGFMFAWKWFVLFAIIIISILLYRPFCKYLCPLGAVYSVFNGCALLRMDVDESACVKCGTCSKACGMGITPYKTPNHRECVRCGGCVRACPCHAIHMGVRQARHDARPTKS